MTYNRYRREFGKQRKCMDGQGKGFRKGPSMGIITGTGGNSASKGNARTDKEKDLGRDPAWDL